MCLAIAAHAGGPQAQLDNGVLHVTVELPNGADGFYHGTRFDWSGVISGLTYAGHSFYGPWFTRVDPAVRDFIFDGNDIVAGKQSSASGPVEEFVHTANDMSGQGYAEAKAGGTFVKIGVGILRKPDEQRYSQYRDYEIVNLAPWKVRVRKTSVEFTQKVVDPGSGYGYLYTKTIRLVSGQPRMVIEHSLKNLGRLPIATDVYDHNFLVLDHQATGPDFTVSLPFPIQTARSSRATIGQIDGNRVSYKQVFAGRDTFDVTMNGFGTAKDNDIRMENARVGAGVHITSDHPFVHGELWSIRTVIGMEPYIELAAKPGETIHWIYHYEYYTLPKN